MGNSAGFGEADLRCATSRGYYAALHAADAVIPKVEGVERERIEGSHQFIIRRAIKYSDGPNPGRLEARKIAQVLKKLKDQRVHADYDLRLDFSVRDRDDALARAHAILGYCENLQTSTSKKIIQSNNQEKSDAACEVVAKVEGEVAIHDAVRPALKRIR